MAPAKRPVWDPPRGLTPDSPVAEAPAERSLVERDRARVWHPFTQMGLERDPVPVASASGAVLTLEDGREIIDAVSSWWTSLHGHGEPALVEAMANQARTLDHVMFAGTTHRWAVELAAPCAMGFTQPTGPVPELLDSTQGQVDTVAGPLAG